MAIGRPGNTWGRLGVFEEALLAHFAKGRDFIRELAPILAAIARARARFTVLRAESYG